MTDEQMDARLRAAGQRWRAATDGDTALAEPPEVDEELLSPPHRRRTWLFAAAAAAVVALVAGLAIGLRGEPRHGRPSADAAGLQGTVWLLQGTPGTRSTATFYVSRDGNLVADDECRLIGGHASVTGSKLTVSDSVVRYKGCTDQYGPGFYDSGTKLLQGNSTYSIDSSGLTITRGRASLRFVPAPKAVPPPSLDVPTLTDTTWRAPDGKTLRIDAANGNVSGTLCTGRATTAGPTVTFARCGAPVGQGTYLVAISGATLTLKARSFDPGFSGMSQRLTFLWQPTDPSITDPVALTDRTWTLESVVGQPATSERLRFHGRIATIDNGCTRVRYPVEIKRGSFVFGPFGPPRTKCTAQSATVDSLLREQSAAWVVRDGTLIIYGGGSQTFALVYRAEQAQTTATPIQGQWTLAKVFDTAGGVRATTAPATLTIAANGTVTGTDGCRTFRGTVSTSATTATFTLTMPEPACSPIIEQTAGLVDRVLSGPVAFTVAPDVLVLSKNDIGRLTFTGAATGGPNPQLITAHTWQVTAITYGSGQFRNGAAVQDGGATLSFTGDTYKIEHPCSIVSGPARLASGVVTFGARTVDDHSCPPPVPHSLRDVGALAIDRILTGQVRWSVSGSVLTLTGHAGSVKAVGGLPSDLTGSRWRLISTARGNSSTTAVGSVVLSFPSHGLLSVERCYTSGAQVEVGDSLLVVFNLHTTIARPCPSGPAGTQQQNQVIDRVLAGGVTWSIDANVLTLSADGASLTFRR